MTSADAEVVSMAIIAFIVAVASLAAAAAIAWPLTRRIRRAADRAVAWFMLTMAVWVIGSGVFYSLYLLNMMAIYGRQVMMGVTP
tara:strand:+ start:497 stop:751 length:255 start_codon:yes stop_codon:yes gene_type:complete